MSIYELMPAPFIQRYGARWPADASDLKIEIACIQMGGTWTKDGVACGLGKAHHFERMRQICWPWLDDHRWHTLCRDEMLSHKVTTLMGSGGTGKTHSAAWLFLCDYWCFPNDTIVLVSSTDLRGLELRVWGEIKKLFQAAKDVFPWLPGNLIESKHAIATDDLEETKVRDLRRGIIGIPCMQNGKFVGLGKYIGIHQKRVRLIADEAQFMGASFLSAFANLNQNEDFWACVLGNPNDPFDPLGKAAEPVDGWAAHLKPDKTCVWDTKFMSGRCVNLIGTDSPNYDFPEDQPTRFRYLPHRAQATEILKTFGPDSYEYHSQCVGSMRTGVLNRRVITRDLCRQFGALDKATWKGTPTTKIYALDAAYGGDRCVGGFVEFGEDITGKIILLVHPPHIIPVRIATKQEPEDQIAERVKADCEMENIPPENMFHDATGRGSLGTSLARAWSAQTNPVEFGGKPTDRPVSLDHFIRDPRDNRRRLKLCSEHYSKFVTELWFTVRYCIEAGQMRLLPEDVMEEGCMREWSKVKGDKIELETKEKMKERAGRSPDLFDWLAVALEGARRRGFRISKMASESAASSNLDWLDTLRRQQRDLRRSHTLNHCA